MTRDEAAKWLESLYGKRGESPPPAPPPQVIERPMTPTNIIYVPAEFWRRYRPKKSA